MKYKIYIYTGTYYNELKYKIDNSRFKILLSAIMFDKPNEIALT